MNKCTDEKLGHLLPLYETGSLGRRQSRRFEDHLLVCDFCRTELTQMHQPFKAMNLAGDKILAKLRRDGISYEVRREQLLAAASQAPTAGQFVDDILRWIFYPNEGPGVRREVITAAALTLAALLLLIVPSAPPSNPFLPFVSSQKPPYSATLERAPIESSAWSKFTDGMQLFQLNEFKRAAELFLSAAQQDSLEGEFWLYLGICYYLDHQVDSAIEALGRAVNLTEPAQKNRALWYQAQAYLLAAQPAPAIAILKSLSAQGLEYSQEADSLLARILPLYKGKSP